MNTNCVAKTGYAPAATGFYGGKSVSIEKTSAANVQKAEGKKKLTKALAGLAVIGAAVVTTVAVIKNKKANAEALKNAQDKGKKVVNSVLDSLKGDRSHKAVEAYKGAVDVSKWNTLRTRLSNGLLKGKTEKAKDAIMQNYIDLSAKAVKSPAIYQVIGSDAASVAAYKSAQNCAKIQSLKAKIQSGELTGKALEHAQKNLEKLMASIV